MKNLLFLIFGLFVLLLSCKESENQYAVSYDGIWEQLGYGKIFEIKNDSVRIFDICKVGCNLYEHVDLRSEGKVESYSQDSLTLRKNMKTYKFVRLNTLPALCTMPNKKPYNPDYNFEVLWNTFNENYSFFETRQINWGNVYKKYKSQLTNETSEIELYLMFDEMLNNLNDGHVSLDMPDSLSDTLDILNEMQVQEPTEKAKVGQFELGDIIVKKYCKEIKKHNAGMVKWGMMKDNIAYIQLNAMLLLAYYDIPRNLTLQEFFPLYSAEMDKRIAQREDEIKGADLLMDTIVADIRNAKAVIFDLRFNGGGKDEAGLEFIGHFVKERKLITSKKARHRNDFANHQSMFLEPKKPSFDKKVYILTSNETASASEIAVLATTPYDNFIRIGSNTEGVFSDGLDKRLPNGWEYTLSNEIYVDSKGANYEGSGIPPDIRIDYPKNKGAFLNLLLAQLQSSGDEAIEQIFKIEAKTNAKN